MARDRYAKCIVALRAAAERGEALSDLVEALLPRFSEDLAGDRRRRALLSLWGLSSNRDEVADTCIVHRPILEALAELVRLPLIGTSFHAGLMHTYGYLLSDLQTPYGLKRDRWLRPDLDRHFGLPGAVLRDRPDHGTLFANATYLMGQIAFRERRRERALLRRQRKHVAPCLANYDFDGLEVERVTERVIVDERSVSMHADLVASPRMAGRVLIYSAEDPARELGQLFTMFPMTNDAAERFAADCRRECAEAAQAAESRLRFNAVLDLK